MAEYRYVFGPIPSRRMGLSLGVSPIPQKYCNYSCVYCQLGRTRQMKHRREEYYPLEQILAEAKEYLQKSPRLDVVTIVGEGEPTLFSRLGELIGGLKKLTVKPVAVITNGALLADARVREEMKEADIVLPSLDAYDEVSFKKINRPFGKISFAQVYQGLQSFSREFEGEIWLETMLVKGLNDDEESLARIKKLLDGLAYDRLYLNTPVRPPAENWVEEPDQASLEKAVNLLGGIAVDLAASDGFSSEIQDDFEAVCSIIKRHPMNQHEIKSFLEKRGCWDWAGILQRLDASRQVEKVIYKGYETYRGV
ncbi:MAG: radical SAM protein [Clostridia bacterium]|nr:radical SAM protein [Clostridia bacterium]